MGTLTAFLHDEAKRLRAEAPAREAKTQDWVRAVTALLEQLQAWAREADTDGIIELNMKEWWVPYKEEGIGVYKLPRLHLKLDTRSVWVMGKARNVADRIQPPGHPAPRQADGLVILTDSASDDRAGAAKYYLYRLAEPDGDRWFLRHPLQQEVTPLDRERFEAVLVGLLK
jgi:hypothetical protein